MGAWRTGQQSNRPRRWVQRLKRYPLWLRLFLATIMGGGIASATYILITHGNFSGQEQTANNQFILSTVLAVLGIIISIFLYFFPLPESKNEPPVSPPPSSSTGNPSLIWHVPYPRDPYFIDSRDILSDLHEKFNENKTGSLTQPKTISGMGGLGKTATALEYAYRYSSDYHAVLWANADTREALISDFMSITDRLNLPEKDDKDQSRVVNAVKRWLGEKEGWLLILDNADDLKMVNEFIPSASKGHILLTTHAAGIGKLDGVEVKKMESEDGALFLLRRAKKIARDALLEQASANDILMAREIVKAMDGLPLALDQVGAYIDATGWSLSFYLEHYRKEQAELLKLRSGPNRNHPVDPDPVHPDPVASTWSLSFKKAQRANRAAANLLRLYAFLSPDAIPEEIITEGAPALGWTLQHVAVKPLKLEAAIGELRKYSLVRRNSDQTLTIHRLVQIALRNSMGNRAQRQWARRTVGAVYRAFPNPEFENWQECQRCLPQALVCATLIEEYSLEFAEASRLLYQTAYYLYRRAQYPQAEPLYKQAQAIWEKALGPEHPDVARSLNNLALLYYAQGKYEQAEPLWKQAQAIWEKALGPEHPDVALSLNNLAELYRDQGKYAQAEPLYQGALAIVEKQLGPEHPNTAAVRENYNALVRNMKREGSTNTSSP